MTSFVIEGPFEIAYEKRQGGRTLVFDDFWTYDDVSQLKHRRGCYIFAIRNKGLTPIYVGKATKSFKQETFNPANRHKYHNGFSHYARGKPLMYFVVHPEQKGPVNAKQIGQIEDFLIQAGVVKNPNLQNVVGAQQPGWRIKGVIRSGAGNHTSVERDFRKLFDLEDQ